jgi:excisionase family DNA binding protein
MDDRVLITVSEAARRLGTYPNAINRWIAKGELEAFRVEGRGFRLVDAEQVEALRLAPCGLGREGDAFRVRRVGTPRSSGF